MISNIPGILSPTSWLPPADLSADVWESIGDAFGRADTGIQWWVGDWWNAFKPAWGDRWAFLERHPDWPAYSTVRRCAAVCSSFDTARRRAVLTWQHHAEVVGEPKVEQDSLLDWCEEPVREGKKPRPTREVRGEMWRRRRIEAGVSVSGSANRLEELLSSGQKFGCLYVDPPWLYDNQGTRAATSDHYEGLTVDELCNLPPYSRIGELAAPDAHLHLWITNAFLFDAPRIFAAWGFEYRSTFIWVKPSIGIGNYWRNSHEILLTAVRGDAKRFNDKNLRSWLECDRSRHSEKPEQVRAMLERASPGPFLELFGRREIPGWMVWGNEVQRDLLAPPMMEAAE